MSKKQFLKIFAKSQIASLIGTIVDNLVMIFCKEIFVIYYVIAKGIGAIAGAVTNFLINRHWTWNKNNKKLGPQAAKYALTSAGSLLLNILGTWFSTEYFNIDYRISSLLVGLIVAIGFNFVMHKYYVFK